LAIAVRVRAGNAEEARVADSALVIITSWCFIQTAIALLLGSLGLFGLPGILAAETVAASTGFLALVKVKSTFRNESATASCGDKPFDNVEKLMILSIAWLGAFLAVIIISKVINEYDSLSYHLPTMALWFKNGYFARMDVFPQQRFFPFNWEVLCSLFLVPFGSDFLVVLPNLLAWCAIGLSAYLLARTAGAARPYALAASCLAMALPRVVRMVNSMQVELALTSFFLAALYFAVSHAESGSKYRLLLFFSTLSIMVGIKTSGIVYALILLAALAASRLYYRRRRKLDNTSLKGNWEVAILILALTICLGIAAFWYAANYFETGNPLGNLGIKLFGWELLEGKIDTLELGNTSLASRFRILNPQHWLLLWSEINRTLGLPFLVILLLVLASPILLAVKKKGGLQLASLMVLALILLVIYIIQPYSGTAGPAGLSPHFGNEFRFAFLLIYILAVIAACGATNLRPPGEVVSALVLLSCARLMFGSEMFIALLIALLVGWPALEALRKKAPAFMARRTIKIAAVLAAAALATVWTHSMRLERETNRLERYGPIVNFLDENITSDERIGYLLTHRIYSLYGGKLQRDVVAAPMAGRSLRRWIRELKRQRIDLIAVGPLLGGWARRREVTWLEDEEGRFERVFGRDPTRQTCFYRLKAP